MFTETTTTSPAVGDVLQDHYWPPVRPFSTLAGQMAAFLVMEASEKATYMSPLRAESDVYGEVLHRFLADIYSYVLGYRDGPCSSQRNDELEVKLLQAKIFLERELLESWLKVAPPPDFVETQEEAAVYLEGLTANNPGVEHPLFGFLEKEASRSTIETFLRCEVVRNEVVDDEVAMLVVGLQGKLKAVAAANLWDECGHGRLQQFHTHWLRRLVAQTAGWDEIADYRASDLPWFARVTSNVNGALLTRPAHKLRAYGCFLVFESWVAPHFRRVLRGMERVGLDAADTRIYFDAHVRIDPFHSQELLDGIRLQRPQLTLDEVAQVLNGAHIAVAAGSSQYDRMLPYLDSLNS